MDGDPNLVRSSNSNLNLNILLRNAQAASKRHRSIGKMLPKRCVLPQRETSAPPATVEAQEDASFTLPSISATNFTNDDQLPPNDSKKGNFSSVISQGKMLPRPVLPQRDTSVASANVEAQEDASFTLPSISTTNFTKDDQRPQNDEPKHHQMVNDTKKVKFSSVISQGDGQMATRLDNLSYHMDSLALTEMDWEAVNRFESSNVISNEPKHQTAVTADSDGVLRSDGASSVLGTNHLSNFLLNDVMSSSCATTTCFHASSAPRLYSTTHSSCSHKDSPAVASLAAVNLKSQNIALGEVQRACPPSVPVSGANADRLLSGSQASSSVTNSTAHAPKIQSQVPRDLSQAQGQFVKDTELGDDASAIPPPCPPSKDLRSHADTGTTKSEKQEKAQSQKKSYDPDLFFKVNGKLYQRLGKIGSGGSSEVHKVISSDCTIYALKKIKLKGRDYATASGFCQEIIYLKKLKKKDHIIQLIDYEVTDKALLHEVMNGPSSSNKENKVKDDGFIYMVLEYGDIDFAHMLSQKWKEIERSNSTMDENWLRFYWQQILLAVNTIHEERIVHSDLKPANFLLVKGSLKLIDFGIAKAIMSDTTNIQRDAQVGTLSYMSPEAFLCNETDANGNIIKCGRSSDIWSLGCILYQMVYGRTPFSEYKTFWAKFKVITDPNHEITYGPVSNPWLLDLMKKCLTWERNERWRIPQLLEHPFLVPPLQQVQNYNFIQTISENYTNDKDVSSLCSELQSILGDSTAASPAEQISLLSQISGICQQLMRHIGKTN